MTHTISKLKEIHECFQHAAESQPAYGEMLPFFENLYEIQETAVSGTHPKNLEKNASVTPPRNTPRTPLIDRRRIRIDEVSVKQVLNLVCTAASDASPKLADAAAILSAHMKNDDDIIQSGLDYFINDYPAALQALSERVGIDKSIFVFFLYHSIWPSLAQHVLYFQEKNRIDPQWQDPFCPICGSAPSLAFFSENGKRFLVCGFCRYEWPVKRILCAHCGNEEGGQLNYFFSEQEKAYRVDTCDRCMRYIKTVDTRQLSRRFYPPLESLITLHLDFQAEAMGYQGEENPILFPG